MKFTSEHEKKCEKIAKKLGIKNLVPLIPATSEHVKECLKTDEYLNNIKLSLWDEQDFNVKNLARSKGFKTWSNCESVCVLKHVARYHYNKTIGEKNMKNAEKSKVLKDLKELKKNTDNSFKKSVINDCIEKVKEYDRGEGYFEDLMRGGCVSGMVGKLICTGDIKEYFKKYIDEIMEFYQELKEEFGEIENRHGTDEITFITWLCYEEMTRKIGQEIGIEI